MKTIKEIKEHLGLRNIDIAKMFGYKTPAAYNKSSARKRLEQGLELFYEKIIAKMKENENN